MEYKTMHRTLLGHVNVDSGQLMVTDPCYLTNFENNAFKPTRKYVSKADPLEIIEWPQDFYNYEEDIIKPYDKNMNTLIKKGLFVKLEDEELADTSYSYNGSCSVTCYSLNQGGELGNGRGVSFSSGYGDGSYPVYAHYEDNRIKKIEIEFFTDEEDDDAI
jgi:hypothetical protein